jgi:hypothetical protein
MFIHPKRAPNCIGYLIEASSLSNDIMQKRKKIEAELREHGEYKELTVTRTNSHTLTFEIQNVSGWTTDKATEMCTLLSFIFSKKRKEINELYNKRKVRDLLNKHPEREHIALVGQLLECTDPMTITGVKTLLNSPGPHNIS